MMHDPAPTGLEAAPFFADVAEAPATTKAWWVRAEDGTRLRMGVWPGSDPAKGTIIMCPGRTEYIEKYGRTATDLTAPGYAMVAFDWRGQGLADRPEHNRDMGHVETFDEYRQDVSAFRAALEVLDLPKPWFLIGHSMGGCIGLRALYDGLPITAAAFTGPMWGLQMTPFLRQVAPLLFRLAGPMRMTHSYVPTMGPSAPMEFDDNILTSDRDNFEYMERQTATHPELSLGGPSYTWVEQAVIEGAELMEMPPLDLPVVTLVGSEELRVSLGAPRERMESWPRGELIMIDGARHEILLEAPEHRNFAIAEILGLFARAV